MIDFELSEELKVPQKTVREFAAAEVAPYCKAWNEEELPHELMPEAVGAGAYGHERAGALRGRDGDAGDPLVVEELAAVDGSVAITVASHNGLCTGHILPVGTEGKQKYLPQLATGTALGAHLTEPGSGRTRRGARTRAERLPDGRGASPGPRRFITQGSVGGIFVVLAVTDLAKKQHGITAFILKRHAGVPVGAVLEKMGLHASDTAELILEDVRVPDCRSGWGGGSRFIDTLRILDKGRITIASMALGLGWGRTGRRWLCQERRQFGKPRVSSRRFRTCSPAPPRSWRRRGCS